MSAFLQSKGFRLKPEFVATLPLDNNDALTAALNADLREVGAPSLPNPIPNGPSSTLQGPLVLQVLDAFNVLQSAADRAFVEPTENRAQKHKRMMKLLLTDGVSCVSAVEHQAVSALDDVSFGGKLAVSGATIRNGLLVLNDKCVTNLRGSVLSLQVAANARKTKLRHALTGSHAPLPENIVQALARLSHADAATTGVETGGAAPPNPVLAPVAPAVVPPPPPVVPPAVPIPQVAPPPPPIPQPHHQAVPPPQQLRPLPPAAPQPVAAQVEGRPQPIQRPLPPPNAAEAIMLSQGVGLASAGSPLQQRGSSVLGSQQRHTLSSILSSSTKRGTLEDVQKVYGSPSRQNSARRGEVGGGGSLDAFSVHCSVSLEAVDCSNQGAGISLMDAPPGTVPTNNGTAANGTRDLYSMLVHLNDGARVVSARVAHEVLQDIFGVPPMEMRDLKHSSVDEFNNLMYHIEERFEQQGPLVVTLVRGSAAATVTNVDGMGTSGGSAFVDWRFDASLPVVLSVQAPHDDKDRLQQGIEEVEAFLAGI